MSETKNPTAHPEDTNVASPKQPKPSIGGFDGIEIVADPATEQASYSIDMSRARLRLTKDIYNNIGAEFIPEPMEKVQRFDAPEKRTNNKACWVYFHPSGAYAHYGSYITGERFTWRADDFEALDTERLLKIQAEIEQSIDEGRKQRQWDQMKAAKTAKSIVATAEPAKPSHPYLVKKRVIQHNLLQSGDVLIVPLFDTNGEVENIQRIYPDGTKRFLTGGRVTGLYATIGQPFSTDTLYVCEGWATGATLHEDTGHPVVAAMNANNLLAVCTDMALKAPANVQIVVAGDNDHRTEGNPGLTKALEASEAIGAMYAYPNFPCNYKDCCCTDFNDGANCCHVILEASND